MEDNNEILLNDITFLALDHGIESISDVDEPLIAFSITEDEENNRDLKRFVTERIEDGVLEAQNYISTNKEFISRYAISWDGFVTIQNVKYDAIIVEAGDKTGQAQTLCQRYKRKGLLKKKLNTIGNAALIEKPKSRLS